MGMGGGVYTPWLRNLQGIKIMVSVIARAIFDSWQCANFSRRRRESSSRME